MMAARAVVLAVYTRAYSATVAMVTRMHQISLYTVGHKYNRKQDLQLPTQ